MIINYKKLHPDAEAPKKATRGSFCWDIKTIEDGELISMKNMVWKWIMTSVIKATFKRSNKSNSPITNSDFTVSYEKEYPVNTLILRTGIAYELPENACMMVFSRSGHGFKYSTSLVNGTGIIDSDYRGEVRVGLINHGMESLHIDVGDRVAQCSFIDSNGTYAKEVIFIEVDGLGQTVRGEGGYGSTGK